MNVPTILRHTLFVFALALPALAAPVIDPIGNVNVPEGKSLIIPVTATSTNGLPLTFTATSSTNRITVQVHTNNPFWKMTVVQAVSGNPPGSFQTPFRGGVETVTNIGDMTFMLFRDVAPHTVDVIQGFTMSGLYTSNTIFHRVIAGFMDQGGDPLTNGTGGPVFQYDDEFNPQAIFSGNGQLALANTGKDTDGSQFFVTVAPFRAGDFSYTIFGQLLRGFNVLSNINNTATDTNNRPLADVIITRASIVPDNFDTVLTITGTNRANVKGTIKVIADDGAGGRATNTFTATTATDANKEAPFIYPTSVTNLVVPVNKRLTNFVYGFDFPGVTNNWYGQFGDANSSVSATNSFYNAITNKLPVTNQLELVVIPNSNYVGAVSLIIYVSPNPSFGSYDLQKYTFAVGDTPISAQASNFTAQALMPFTNQLVATFTNGVPGSDVTNFTAFVNWGDNSTNSGVIVTNLIGQLEVLGAHIYTNAGTYPVYITIQSYLGAAATVVSTASVPPGLSLTIAGTNNVITWPAWATDYQLQSVSDLADVNWQTISNFPVLNGYDSVVTNGTTNGVLFYRLIK